MALNLSTRLFAGRELVDRIARQAPARLAVTVFGAVVLLFTALLMPPFATETGKGASLVDALFTATSAVCVTGLVVVPTGEYWSTYGHVVILLGIKIGGLGIMTLASILGMAVSRRIGLTQRLLTAAETKTAKLGEVGSLVRVVIITSTALELLIALLLFPRFLVLEESPGEAAWHAVFYGISAFNNAGFVPTAEGLAPHVGDWMLCLPIIIGVFIGSLGFPVILNVARARRGTRGWSLHTKLTLTMSVALVVIATVLFATFEWRNEGTLGPLDWHTKLLASLFAGVMPRSGGFSTIDVGSMHESSWLITDALMFVGGGSASTAGGIKVTTLAVMLIAIVAEARGDRDMDVYGRRIPRDTLRLAIAVTFIGATAVLLSSILLLEITGWTLDVVLFEVISAFATVGLSTGVTESLPEAGKYVLVVLMFIGRTGTMTFAAALALRDRRRIIRMPEERPIIG
ncbi:potassium uptake TrkH family protein [Sediminihabitans luteus]|uniref:Potassium uptake TrkH family protein n=1 Tax=Sediminihabitans luteus TaxID=1138585 RepID=A0A2M9CZP8_9CELL|nr:potassium transporter TrkG [Sediminihabitans luteus]PJJ77380.1 potassium uptake TrkH family protein [Sediminihabitans luteus]GII98273.1 potassium transporter Trk [Sediminihabitans luteus]